eukprot:scaffold153478_cov36-Cyclotella_meneghiniana.AAC.1
MAMFFEVYLRNHHGVAAAAEVGGVSELFREEIARVYYAGNVLYFRETKLVGFTYVVLFEVDVFSPLTGSLWRRQWTDPGHGYERVRAP